MAVDRQGGLFGPGRRDNMHDQTLQQERARRRMQVMRAALVVLSVIATTLQETHRYNLPVLPAAKIIVGVFAGLFLITIIAQAQNNRQRVVIVALAALAAFAMNVQNKETVAIQSARALRQLAVGLSLGAFALLIIGLIARAQRRGGVQGGGGQPVPWGGGINWGAGGWNPVNIPQRPRPGMDAEIELAPPHGHGPAYRNEICYLSREPVAEIPREDIWVSHDRYAFDLDELLQLLQNNGGVFRNPHTNQNFSRGDCDRLEREPRISDWLEGARAEWAELQGRAAQVFSRQTKLALRHLAMFTSGDGHGGDMDRLSAEDMTAFSRYYEELPDDQRGIMDHYQISHGYREEFRPLYDQVVTGDYLNGQCRRIAAKFFWKFLYDVAPELCPQRLRDIEGRAHYGYFVEPYELPHPWPQEAEPWPDPRNQPMPGGQRAAL